MTKRELEIWIERYGQDIYSFCTHLCRDRMEADELYQDTWLKVMKTIRSIQTEQNVKGFILSVAVGLWKNRKRKYAWRNRIAPQIPYEQDHGEEYISDYSASPEEEMIDRQTKKIVWDAVEALPEKFRIIVMLYYMEELTLPQISRSLHIPEGTVKSRLYKARKILEKELGDLYE